MSAKIGLECKLFRNTGSFGSPTWVEVTRARDVTVNTEKGKADISIRGSEWRLKKGTLKDLTFEFELLYDPANDDFEAFRDAYLNNTEVDIWAADGPASSGSQGLRAVCEVFAFSNTQPLEQGVMIKVTCEPSNPADPPDWYEHP